MITRGPVVRHELVRRRARVLETSRLTPSLFRVRFSGPELALFPDGGPTDHVKLLLGDDVRRDYTPRRFRHYVEGGELDIDFVDHRNPGPATRWGLAAAPTHTIEIGGPRGSRMLPVGANRYVLGADETALPAAARWLEQLPQDVPVHLLLSLRDAADAAYLDEVTSRPSVSVTVIAPGADEFLAAMRAETFSADTFVWCAGEAGSLIPTRRYLRRELGLTADQVSVDGYWREGEAGRDHHAPLDPEDPEE